MAHVEQFYDDPTELVRSLSRTFKEVDPEETMEWKRRILLGYWTVGESALLYYSQKHPHRTALQILTYLINRQNMSPCTMSTSPDTPLSTLVFQSPIAVSTSQSPDPTLA